MLLLEQDTARTCMQDTSLLPFSCRCVVPLLCEILPVKAIWLSLQHGVLKMLVTFGPAVRCSVDIPGTFEAKGISDAKIRLQFVAAEARRSHGCAVWLV